MTFEYNPADIKTMQVADEAILPGKNRVEEIKNYAQLAGIKRIGIAHCISMIKEATILKDYLSSNFEVFTVDCKYGRLSNALILGAEAKGVSCNPAGQAAFLSQQDTELNIVMGLCVGHDMVFSTKSAAPSTTLIVKDRAHQHNPMETFKEK